MEGIETLAKGDLQEVHKAFMDSNDGNMYKQPLNNVYQSVNNRLSETVKELNHKLEKFTGIDKENAALRTEVAYMKQTLDAVVKERDQLASELKNLEDQRYNIDQAKENERKVVQLRDEVEALEAKYNAEKAKNQDLDSRFKREVDEFYAKRNLVEAQRTELEREKRAADEKHKEEKKRLDRFSRELEDKKLELTKKEELLTSKIKDQDTHNRRIRYSRSNSPIGASKSPRLFNSTFHGSEIRDGVNASRDYRDVPSATLPMNSFARDDIASFPQIGAIQDVRGGSDLSQRAREAAGNESRLDESHLDDIRQDLTAQRKEVKLERETLKREKEEFQTERAHVLKELGEVETLKSRIKALEQENERLKQSLEASQGQLGGALFRLPNVFAVLVLGLAVLSLGFGFGNNWQMLK
jgi:chromosome segregation ATPase